MQDFLSDNDAELLVYMAEKDDDPTAARDAWAEFYERHAEYLHAVCWRAYADILHGDTDVCDLVVETFRRAFDRAGSFSCGDVPDDDHVRRLVRAWLGQIAHRLFQDLLRKRGRMQIIQFESEALEQIPVEEKEEADEEQVERVREALATLSEREQLVIRVTFQWYRPGEKHQRLPNHVADELAASLQTTTENLRQIRRRALDRVRRYLTQPEHNRETMTIGAKP